MKNGKEKIGEESLGLGEASRALMWNLGQL